MVLPLDLDYLHKAQIFFFFFFFFFKEYEYLLNLQIGKGLHV